MSIDMVINGKTIQVPGVYICPITLNVMCHPLLSKTGMRYERSAILAWLVNSDTCPMTRQPLHLSNLISDRALELEIKSFRKKHGITERGDDDDWGIGKVTDHFTDESISVYAVGTITRDKHPHFHRRRRVIPILRRVRQLQVLSVNNRQTY